MAKARDGMHIGIGQLPRYSRPVRIYLNNYDTENLEPINSWSQNLNIVKEQKEEEEKQIQK